jgi:ribosome recycling factor
MNRQQLIAALRGMDEPAPKEEVRMSSRREELRRSTTELLDRLAAEDAQRAVDERVQKLVGERLAKIEENTRPKEPPVYRSTLTPAQKSRLMRQLGSDGYLALPWAPPR